jgi:hypothetical protein
MDDTREEPTVVVEEPSGGRAGERERVKQWQVSGLERLGFEQKVATTLVTEAWMGNEHHDLVHRFERLLAAGATHDQAARILVHSS